MADKELVYHTFYAEFRGASSDEVVQALYENTRRETGINFDDWWAYQKQAWKKLCGLDIPDDPKAGNASRDFIDVLLKVGALEPGPKPGALRV